MGPKQIHTIILDAAPLLKNEPPISTLISQAEQLVTVPSVISEIKDKFTRARVETMLLPFLTLREPRLESIRFVEDFSKRTGDLAVLSRPDVQVLALAYELEIERNEGDWRLRRVPGQKGLNGSPLKKQEGGCEPLNQVNQVAQDEEANRKSADCSTEIPLLSESTRSNLEDSRRKVEASVIVESPNISKEADALENLNLLEESTHPNQNPNSEGPEGAGGWITSCNIRKRHAKDSRNVTKPRSEPTLMQVATLTSDFAMQNVLLRINLNLLDSSLEKIRHLRSTILRCHACFTITREMERQFCPRCGKPTLTRVTCSTSQNGTFTLHLKKNMQWTTRGDRYSVPKPVSGSASGQVKGGGKGGWGQKLILAEDQKEYLQAMQGRSRQKEKDLMDEDYWPSLLTGDRGRANGRPKIGAGRNVNSKRR